MAGPLCVCRSGPSVEDSSNGVVAYFGSGTASSSDPAFAPQQVYSGIFSSNFEISWFWPEEVPAETWWVSGGELGRFRFVFLFCSGVQVLFGVAAAESLNTPLGYPSASAPVALEICPACQHLEPRTAAVGLAAVAPSPPRRCSRYAAADLEALKHWRWREEGAGSEVAPLV